MATKFPPSSWSAEAQQIFDDIMKKYGLYGTKALRTGPWAQVCSDITTLWCQSANDVELYFINNFYKRNAKGQIIGQNDYKNKPWTAPQEYRDYLAKFAIAQQLRQGAINLSIVRGVRYFELTGNLCQCTEKRLNGKINACQELNRRKFARENPYR